jgi:hypothetical protein
MKLHIQLIFVFVGPGRPWKRGGTAGRVDYDRTRLLIQLLDRLRVPHHRAPAEAEAECARLQQLGIVDAVWSDDADALMFGCTMLIRDHRRKDPKKTEAKKDIRMVDVFDASRIEQHFGLTRSGILLFVILVGGDYNTKGLEGCGPVAALEAIKHNSGSLADGLWNTPVPIKQRDLNMWALELSDCFCATRRNVSVPPGFPRDLHFKNYNYPKVSSDEQLHDLNGLRRGWSQEIDEVKLRYFFRERFNIWTKGWLKHVMPPLLAKKLMQVTISQGYRDSAVHQSVEDPEKNEYSIKIRPRRGKATSEDALESKITFLPHHVSAVDLMNEPQDSQGHPLEDWQELKGEKGAAFDPSLPIRCEMVDYILVHGLGQHAYDELKTQADKPQSKKRKQADDEDDAGLETSPKEKPKKTQDQDATSKPKAARKPRKKKEFNEVPGDTPPPEDRSVIQAEAAGSSKSSTVRGPKKRKESNEVPGNTPPPEGGPRSGSRKPTSAKPRKKKQPFNEVPGDTPPPDDHRLGTQDSRVYEPARMSKALPRSVFRVPRETGYCFSQSPPDSQPLIRSFESSLQRSPTSDSSLPRSLAHGRRTASRPTPQHAPDLPDLIVLDDDDDVADNISSIQRQPEKKPAYAAKHASYHEEELDLNLAEAIRLSLLQHGEPLRSNIGAARFEGLLSAEATAPPRPVPLAIPREQDLCFDWEAIAKARIAHLKWLGNAAPSAQKLAPVIESAKVSQAARAVTSAPWECIDLTDD